MELPESDIRLESPRFLTEAEKWLLGQMLEEPFQGRDQLRTQLEDARVVAHGPGDTRTIVFAAPSEDAPRASVVQRVPVDALMPDLDGTEIQVALHVVDGYVQELEAYRVDLAPIERTELDGAVKLINRYPLSFD
jgi:hypothetical protein